MPQLDCKNCEASFQGNYCTNCGQKYVDRISWTTIVKDMADALEFKRGLFFNLKAFTFRPRISIREYINGRTKPYLNPVSYVLLGIGLLFISIQLTGALGNSSVDDTLVNTAEKIVYTAGFAFPFVFSLIISLAVIDKNPNFLHGLVVSLFLTGHALIMVVIIRACVFTLGMMMTVDSEIGFYLLVLIGFGFAFVFSRGFLKLAPLQYFLRIIGSTVVVSFILLLAFGVLLTMNVISVDGFEIGKLLRSITDLLMAI